MAAYLIFSPLDRLLVLLFVSVCSAPRKGALSGLGYGHSQPQTTTTTEDRARVKKYTLIKD